MEPINIYMKLGIISDTHGFLNNRIHQLFEGIDAILHAGDIGDDVYIELQTIAPVTAVRGNMDRYGHTATLREWVGTSFADKRIFLVHDLGAPQRIKSSLLPSLEQYLPHIVIFGHTHVPYAAMLNDVFYFNPGSARQGRSGSKASVGLLEIHNAHVDHSVIPLES